VVGGGGREGRREERCDRGRKGGGRSGRWMVVGVVRCTRNRG